MATLGSKHPRYDIRVADWTLMRHSEAGERAIKTQRFTYLPPTQMMITRGLGTPKHQGWQMYDSYLGRAVYHDIVGPALDAMLGVMHKKPARIVLPKRIEKMLDTATFNGDSMQTLLEKINRAQLLTGRIGTMLDVANGTQVNGLPYIVTYETEAIENWDTSKVNENTGVRSLQFVQLNESGYERTSGLSWDTINKWRVLAMGDTTQDIFPGSPPGPVYNAAGVRIQTEVNGPDFKTVEFGGKSLDSIPFVFIGPRDLVPEPDIPPLLPLARIALAIYRGEADYRQALFLQGQQTLVIVGAQDNTGLNADGTPADKQEVGASATIELPIGGDAFYIGASAEGLGALANAIMEDKRQAAHLGANLLETQGGAAESGDALYIRTAARTSSLTTIAKTGAEGLKSLLKQAAVWVGADPEEVVVEPNMEFGDTAAVARSLVDLMTAKMMGAPLSQKSVHGWAARNGFTDMTYEEEQEAQAEEPPPVNQLLNSGAPGDPNEDDEGDDNGDAPKPGDKKPAPKANAGKTPGRGTGGKGGPSRGTGGSKKKPQPAPPTEG